MTDPGRSFGVAAAEYDRGRPEWPEELLDGLPIPPTASVLDLGAGSGKLTRLLARRYATVIAVEPDGVMRALIEVGERLAGAAEAIPLADRSVDAVFAAEAFHWFDGDRALVEIARVLRPRGVLALLWNRFDPKDHVLPENAVPELKTRKHHTFESGEWRRALEHGPFGPLQGVSLPQEREVPRARLLDYFASVSPITSLPEGERGLVLSRVAAALDRPVYRRRWTACLYWTRLER